MFVWFLRAQLKTFVASWSSWLTALAYFAGACFLLAWPLRDAPSVIVQMGQPATLALGALSVFYVLSDFWHQDSRSGKTSVLQVSRQLAPYVLGRALACLPMVALYSLLASITGMLLFNQPFLSAPQTFVSLISVAPGVAGLSLLTSSLTIGSRSQSAILGAIVVLPLLVPLVVFANIYLVSSQLVGTWVTPSLVSLIGLSTLYFILGALGPIWTLKR